MSQRIRILLINDNRDMRKILTDLLSFEPDFKVIGSVRNGFEGIVMAVSLRPDIILMNYSMPIMDGIATTRRILHAMPDAAVVMLSFCDDPQMIEMSWEAGVKAYFRVPIESVEEFYDTIRLVHEGHTSQTSPTHA